MFPVKLAADEVAASKPDPEMYLTACGRSPVARAAGVPVIGVPTLKRQEFPADIVIGSLLDDDLLAWVRGWPRR